MAFPVKPNPLLPAPTGTVHVIVTQFPHQGSRKRECVCMCMCCDVHRCGRVLLCSVLGNRAPGAGSGCRLTQQAASTSLHTQHRNQVVSAHEKTHKAWPGFQLAVSKLLLSFCLIQVALGWREPKKSCWRCRWGRAAPCVLQRELSCSCSSGQLRLLPGWWDPKPLGIWSPPRASSSQSPEHHGPL